MAFKLLRRLWPLPDGYAEAGPSLDELSRQFRKWQLLGLPLLFASLAVFTAGWWLLIRELAEWNARRYEPAMFHLRDTGIMLMIPSGLLGFSTTGVFLLWIYRRLLGGRYESYIRYDNLSGGYDSNRAVRSMMVGAATLSIFLALIVLSWHVVFRQNEMQVHSWCGLWNNTKSYSEIRVIRTAPQLRAPNGQLVDRREYEVEFTDGTKWSTIFEPAGLGEQDKDRLIRFVAGRARQQIRQQKILE